MRVEKITRRGKEFAVIPVADFERLLDDAEMLADVKAYDAAKRRLDRGDDEVVPIEIVERRLAGENPLKIWREHRALTREALAKAARVSRATIAAIESGAKPGGINTVRKLAEALRVHVENLECTASEANAIPGGTE